LQLLVIVTLCGGSAAAVTQTYRRSNDDPGSWIIGFLTLSAVIAAAAIGCWNSGAGLVAMVAAALSCGWYSSTGIAVMKGNRRPYAPALFIGAPLAWVGGSIALITLAYLLVAALFSLFPLPFPVPFQLVRTVFSFFTKQPVATWSVYAVCSYLSIATASVVRNYWYEVRSALTPKPKPAAAPANTPSVRD
jgi:hypothetical protein